MLASSCGVLRACSCVGQQLAADREAEQQRKADEQESAQAAARAADESAAQAKKRAAEDERLAADGERRDLLESYSSMKPWQRAAQIRVICPQREPGEPVTASQYLAGYDGCDSTKLAALLESVKGTPEEGRLCAAANAVKAKMGSSGGMAKCCDGTLSDSCACSDVHRGCCSHHGGVCGCEASTP